jgi:predicted metal-dependent hydrolase
MGADNDIQDALRRGVALFNDREFFRAHEVWEEAWADTWGDERHLLQGLIQVAAGFYKLQIGMPAGTVKLLEKSAEHLTSVPDAFYRVDIAALLPAVTEWRSRARSMVSEWRTDYDPAALPTLQWID